VKAVAAVAAGSQPFAAGQILHLHWADSAPAAAPGQFFLVRCTPSPDHWDPYLRRALPPIALLPDHLALWIADPRDRGLAWLLAQPPGAAIDLLGPGGHGFDLPTSPANVLILAVGAGVGPVWPAMTAALAAGCQVTLALAAPTSDCAPPPSLTPIAVEYRLATADGSAGIRGDLFDLLPGLEGWPDRIYAALPRAAWPRLHAWIDGWRPWMGTGFAQVFVDADLTCGVGACQTCRVEMANGRRPRACVHGPVFDLARLT